MTTRSLGLVDLAWYIGFTSSVPPIVPLSGRRLSGPNNDLEVTPAHILTWDHELIEFSVPEGQGQNLTLVVIIGDQVALFDSLLNPTFSYNPPNITAYLTPNGIPTAGGSALTIIGTSFGISNAIVTITDPLANSSNTRMESALCVILAQTHEEIICRIPPGLGGELTLTIDVVGAVAEFPFAYDKPSIDFFWSSAGGSASGGEELRIYGRNFGVYRTDTVIYIDGTPCRDSVWLADDRVSLKFMVDFFLVLLLIMISVLVNNHLASVTIMLIYYSSALQRFDLEPYLRCPRTPLLTVGSKNVTVHVAYQESNPNDRYFVECKSGYYGGVGEYCAFCGDSESTGYKCVGDNLYLPISESGWWRTLERTPEKR